jgi:hypothetical protein
MEELEKTARELILAITEKTLKSLKDKGLLKEPSKLQMLYSSPEMKSLIKKLSAPKYDPCRKFRKGDKVRLIEWNGRKPFDTLHGLKLNLGEVHIVLDDEYERNEVYIGMSAADEEQSVVHACNLELITPVEDMGPYRVRHNAVHSAWSIYGPFDLSAVNYFYGEHYPYTKETARAAAEAECARLNEEYRKEQN